MRLDVAFCGVCGTDVHIARGHMDHRVRIPQVIGHEMSGTVAELGPGVDGYAVGDPVVVRPLDTRAETPADKGFSHICRGLRFLGIDTPGAFQALMDRARFHAPPTAGRASTCDWPRSPSRWQSPATTSGAAQVSARRVRRRDRRRPDRPAGRASSPRAAGADVMLSEVNASRRELASELGLEVVDPARRTLRRTSLARTDGAGADVVFEVSGSAAGALG